MSKPKKRTMRQLKRTLGVTALILALLIALIPDIGKASTTGTLELLFDDSYSFSADDPIDKESVTVANGAKIVSSGGTDDDCYRLNLQSVSSNSSNQLFDTHVYKYQFSGMQRITHENYNWAVNEAAANGLVIINGIVKEPQLDGTYINAEIHKDADTITDVFSYFAEDYGTSEDFTFMLDFSYVFKAVILGTVNMSVYLGDEEALAGYTSINGQKQINTTTELTIDRIQALNGFPVYVYLNTSPTDTIGVIDNRNYKAESTYSIFSLDSFTTYNYPINASELSLIQNGSSDVKQMNIPSQQFSLVVDGKADGSADYSSAARTEFLSHVSDFNVVDGKTIDYNSRFIDIVDWVELSNNCGLSGDDLAAFNNRFLPFRLNYGFPKSSTNSPYVYRERGSEDVFRVAYCKGGQWYDGVPYSGGPNAYGNSLDKLGITVDLDATVTDLVVYIAREGRHLIPIDKRNISGGDNFAISMLNWDSGKTEDDLISNVYAVLSDVSDPDSAIQSQAQSYLDSIDEVYNVKDYAVVSLHYSGDENGDTDAADVFTTSDNWFDYYYDSSITMATPSGWDFNGNDSDGTSHGVVSVMGYDSVNHSWDILGTATKVSGRQGITFTTNRNYENYNGTKIGYYVLLYYAFVDDSPGAIYGDDKRNETLSGWTFPTSTGSTTVSPTVRGDLARGTYWLRVEATPNNGYDTYICKNLGNWPEITDDYKKRDYYKMSIGSGNSQSTYSLMDPSDYSAITDYLSVRMALPADMADATDGKVILVVYNTETEQYYKYNTDEFTVKNGYIDFDPMFFTAPLEVGIFYNPGGNEPEPEPVETGFFYKYISSTGNWMKDATAKIVEEDIGTKWTMYFREPDSTDASMYELDSRIRNDFGEMLSDEYPIDYFNVTLYETNITETQITDIGTNEITVKVPISSAKTGDKVYVYTYNRNNGDNPINCIKQKTLTTSGNTIEFPVTKSTLENLNPYAIVLIPAEETQEGGLVVENSSNLKNEIEAIVSPDDLTSLWILRFTDSILTDNIKSRLEKEFQADYPIESKGVAFYQFFDMNLYQDEIKDANRITDIGSRVIKVSIPIPEGAKTGDLIYLYKWNANPESLGPVFVNSTTGNYITCNVTTADLTYCNPYMIAVVTAESQELKYNDLIVDDSGSDLAPEGHVRAVTTAEGKEWKLVVYGVPSPNVLEEAIKKFFGENLAEILIMDSYRINLFEMIKAQWTQISNIGDEKIRVTIPIPSKLRNAEGFSMEKLMLFAYNSSSTGSEGTIYPSRVDIIEKSTNESGVPTITILIGTQELTNLNPYTLVFVPETSDPSEGSSQAGNEILIRPFNPDITTDNPIPPSTTTTVDLWALGTPTVTGKNVKLEAGEKLEVVVAQIPDSEGCAIGQAIKSLSGITDFTAQPKSASPHDRPYASSIRSYEIKLKKTDADGNVTWLTNLDDLGGGSLKITIPYQGNLAIPGSAANLGRVQAYALSGGGTPENLANKDVTDATNGTISFDATHFSQYALLYNSYYDKARADEGKSNSSTSATSGASNSSSNSSTAKSGSTGSTSSSSSSATSGANTGSSSNTGSSGGYANPGQGKGYTDMPRTADATTYKAIFILILLAFGAFELISSMPGKKEKKVNAPRE